MKGLEERAYDRFVLHSCRMIVSLSGPLKKKMLE